LCLASCGGNAPQIFGADYRLIVEGIPDAYRERLVLSLAASDEDGFKDLESLYLIADDARLYWKASSKDFVVKSEGRFGIASFVSAYGASFPRGTYRALLIDKAGQRSEREIVIAPPDADPAKLPAISIEAGVATIKSALKERYLQILDSLGAVLASYRLDDAAIDLKADLPAEVYAQARKLRVLCVSESHSLYYASNEADLNEGRSDR
jgi:hypothetical protein